MGGPRFFSTKQEKRYKKLLTGKDELPTADEYEKAVDNGRERGGGIIRINNLNEEAFEDIILSIDHTTKQGKVTFSLVKNCKTAKYPEGNCKLAWDRLVGKYSPTTAPSLAEEDFCKQSTGECADTS